MTNLFDTKRGNSGWTESHIAHWTESDTTFVSCVFSWDLKRARAICRYYAEKGYKVRAGGPAVIMNPESMQCIAEIGGQVDALPHHNPRATFTSRGCIRKCGFCAVPRIEGDLYELADWEPRPIICDNNLLACSKAHFDSVIDRLKSAGIKGVDFNQGLDARLLTKHHASRIAELDLKYVRLAWDDVRLESRFMRAWQLLRGAGIPKYRISVYVLIGFNDTPGDAFHRLHVIANNLNSLTVPMRYQPVDASERNNFVADGWAHWELVAYQRYWSHMQLRAIPFGQWLDRYRKAPQIHRQLELV